MAWSICCGRQELVRILGCVIGEEFAAVLAVAQDGDEAAFSVLWRDVNPALLRYLAVAAPGAAEDVAAETWVQVIRGLAGFHGDERAWRAWLFAVARPGGAGGGARPPPPPAAPLGGGGRPRGARPRGRRDR